MGKKVSIILIVLLNWNKEKFEELRRVRRVNICTRVVKGTKNLKMLQFSLTSKRKEINLHRTLDAADI